MTKRAADFEDALGQLLADYCDTPADDLISALELQLEALREEQQHAQKEQP